MADASRELLILGVLRRSPLSAYDVDRAVHGHAPLYRSLKYGNVYYALKQLALARFVTRREASARRGPAATKAVYRLSALGEKRFRTLLRETLLDVQADDTALEVAFVLLGQFSRDQALELISARRDALAQHERRLKRLLGDMSARSGAAYIGESHAFSRTRAENAFLGASIALLRDPKWSPGWRSDDGPVDDPKRVL